MADTQQSLDKICADAGLPLNAVEYIKAKGFSNLALFSRSAISEELFVQKIVSPFVEGVQIRGAEHKMSQDNDSDGIQAMFLVAWDDAKAARAASLQGTPGPASAAVPALSALPSEEKIPKLLKAGEWKTHIDIYEAKWTPARKFPENILLGAEAVLARMLHEKRSSRHFTPVKLGEILQLRAYTSAGQCNPLAQKASDVKSLGIKNAGGETALTYEESAFDPRSQWAVLDGLESVKWAYTFCDYCNDDVADSWVDYFRRLTRNRPNDLDLVKSVYDAASWRLVSAMRSGKSFQEATAEILADTAWFQDYIDQHRGSRGQLGVGKGRSSDMPGSSGWYSRRSRSPRRGVSGGSGAKSHNKGSKKGKSSKPGVCNKFNEGLCHSADGTCPWNREHRCSQCGKLGHGQSKCWFRSDKGKGR